MTKQKLTITSEKDEVESNIPTSIVAEDDKKTPQDIKDLREKMLTAYSDVRAQFKVISGIGGVDKTSLATTQAKFDNLPRALDNLPKQKGEGNLVKQMGSFCSETRKKILSGPSEIGKLMNSSEQAKKDAVKKLEKLMIEAEEATLAVAKAELDAKATKERERSLVEELGNVHPTEASKYDKDAKTFDELFTDKEGQENKDIKGNSLMIGDLTIVISHDKITTKDYNGSPEQIKEFSKAVKAKAMRNPSEKIVLDGPIEGVVEVLKELAKSKGDLKNTVELGPRVQDQRTRHAFEIRDQIRREVSSQPRGPLRGIRAVSHANQTSRDLTALMDIHDNKPNGLVSGETLSDVKFHTMTIVNIKASKKDEKKSEREQTSSVNEAVKMIVAVHYEKEKDETPKKTEERIQKLTDLARSLNQSSAKVDTNVVKNTLQSDSEREKFDELLKKGPVASKTTDPNASKQPLQISTTPDPLTPPTPGSPRTSRF